MKSAARTANLPSRYTGKSLAVEWTGFARVNTVSPGYIQTEITQFASPDMREQWKDRTVMG